jgi:hypothetical protein
MFIKAFYITNDSYGYLLLLGRKYYTYHASHIHVRAVALAQSFGRSLYSGTFGTFSKLVVGQHLDGMEILC